MSVLSYFLFSGIVLFCTKFSITSSMAISISEFIIISSTSSYARSLTTSYDFSKSVLLDLSIKLNTAHFSFLVII